MNNYLDLDLSLSLGINFDILHSIRVVELSRMLCSSLNIDDKARKIIMVSAMFHDIGKNKITFCLLNKDRQLSKENWQIIKKHPIYGYMLARNMNYDDSVCRNILYHHENEDGTGYPRGIKGDKIPLGAAIIRICDSYDAIRSTRPYKKSMCHEKAIDELIRSKAIYREDILNKFLNLDFNKIEYFYANNKDEKDIL